MGWCQEFGTQINADCDHAMVAASDHCGCPVCGTECRGKFAACGDVWAAGVANVELSRPSSPGAPIAVLNARPPVAKRGSPVANGSRPPRDERTQPEAPRSLEVLDQDLDRLRIGGDAGHDSSGDALLGVLNTLPERISMVIAEATRAENRQILDAGERLSDVLARRVAEQIAKYDAERASDAGSSLEALTHLITEQQRQIDALLVETQRLTKQLETQDQLRVVQQKLDATLAALNERR